jgi:hypothetical protein
MFYVFFAEKKGGKNISLRQKNIREKISVLLYNFLGCLFWYFSYFFLTCKKTA